MMLDGGFIPGGIEWSNNGVNHSVPTLRDQFAMAALTGLLSGPAGDEFSIRRKGSSVIAYEIADAMLAARGGK